MKTNVAKRSYMLITIVIGSCFILFVGLLQACQVNAQHVKKQFSPPHLLDVVRVVGPNDIAVAPNGWAYVISDGGARGEVTIVVLDGPEVIGTIPWPVEPASGGLSQIVTHPEMEKIYIVDDWSNKVYQINGMNVAAVMDIGYAPTWGVLHPDSGLLYVANQLSAPSSAGENPGPGDVAVIKDTEIITRIPLEQPQVMTFNELDRKIYVGQSNPFGEGAKNILVAINHTTMMTETIYSADSNGGIYDIGIDEQNGHIYMTRGDYGLITYWDGTETHQVDVGSLGYSINAIAMDSRHNWLYAASWDGPPSHVVVIEKGEVIAEIPVGYDVRDIAIDETHDFIYTANYRSASMSVIRGTEVITTLSTHGAGPWKIAVDERRGYVYVTNADYASVAVFGFEETTSSSSSFFDFFLPLISWGE